MNTYLNQLVAKNLNLVDTVQPFLLSIFGFLPGSSIELGSEQNWGINQEIVTGDNQDSAITTGLETSPDAQIFSNSDTAIRTAGDRRANVFDKRKSITNIRRYKRSTVN
ncbi:MAG: hypothetical protein SAK29_08195 [Scytonema sp. PMC 1069.18]|nr:hypothetical protein [Scytonema sp. PMC 1069.18]MEC4881710.1 hypothetical protein [Scytonema sp. PMC 1070.18]